MIAVEVAGWLAASAAAFAAAGAWRALAWRMETVARACHELRGPLTAARLGLDYGAGKGELTAERLRAIDLELGRAALVLDDLEAVRTRRAGPRAIGAVDLERLVADSVEAWRPAARANGVELRFAWSGGGVTVWGDRLRLAQVTGNLIANAIEHGGGAVEVHGRRDHGRARVEVTDTGPGLPAPIPELMRGARSGHGRRGRGLAIASAVAAAHGGRVAAAPAVRGARLVLELPAVAPTVLRGPPGSGGSTGLGGSTGSDGSPGSGVSTGFDGRPGSGVSTGFDGRPGSGGSTGSDGRPGSGGRSTRGPGR
jgi:signal transduction histidine kinase